MHAVPSFVLQVLCGLRALLAEPLLQALLCAHQGLAGLSADVRSLVDGCRRELQDREAAEGAQHTGPREGGQDTEGSSTSGVKEGEAGTDVLTAAEADAMGGDTSPHSCSTGGCDSDAVCGASAQNIAAEALGMIAEAEVLRGSVHAAADGAWQGCGDADAVAAAQPYAQHAMQDMGWSNVGAAAAPPATAGPAAAVPAAPCGRPRTYTVEEQAVMRELNLSNLSYVVLQRSLSRRQSGLSWRVQLSAEGLAIQKLWSELPGSAG
jgi:hypothetical protein